jgi:hypothetical protein
MAIFYPFSRSAKADSGALEKRDSTVDFAPSITGFSAAAVAGNGRLLRTR